MGLWIKTPDGTLEKAAGADGAYLPLAGGTVTGNLTVGGQLNVGTEFYVNGQDVKGGYLRMAIGDYNWPSHSFDADKQTGFYLATTGTMGAAGNLLLHDDLQVEGDLQVDGTLNSNSATLWGDHETLSLRNATAAGQPHIGLYHNGVRRGYLGNTTATATELSAEANQLVLGGAGVRVATWLQVDENATMWKNLYVVGRTEAQGNLQVNGNLNVGTEFYVSGQDVKVGYLRAGNGSKGWPSHSFDADKQTGFYLAAGGTIGTAGNLLIDDILQVEGQIKATNGSSAAPVYSFQADSTTGLYLYGTGVATIACAGKNVANFGTAGISFPEGLAEISGTAANVHIGNDGQLRRITDVKQAPTAADISRLEALVEKLSARIEKLEKRPVSSGEKLKKNT